MSDEDPAYPSKPAPDEPAPGTLPPRAVFPPPPDVTYTRPQAPGQPSPRPDVPRRPPEAGRRSENTVRAGAGLAAGVTFAASIIAGFFIGQFTDGRLHDAFPWGTLIFTLLGVAAGFINLLRLLDTTDRKKRR